MLITNIQIIAIIKSDNNTNLGTPAGADAVCAVDEHHGEDGDVPIRLDLLVVVGQVVEDGVVVDVEDVPGQGAQLSEDVTGAGVVLTSKIRFNRFVHNHNMIKKGRYEW